MEFPAAPDAASGFTDRWWTTGDGLKLYARDYPAASGPARLPVVCLHGLTRSSKDFADVAPWIAARGRRVIVPEMRGRGRSAYDPDPMHYVPVTYARDVAALLRAMGIHRAIFLGTSMGGIITMLLAASNRKMIAAAILNDIGAVAAPEGLARIAGYAGQPVQIEDWDAAADYVRRINGAAFPDRDAQGWRDFARRTFDEDEAGRPSLAYDPAISEPIKAGRLKARPIVAWMLFRMLARRRPILLLRGALSDILSPEIALRMKVRAPGLRYAEIDNVGHAPMLTEPQARLALAQFLEAQP